MTDILERLDIATMRLASESQDEATIRRNQTIADAKAHIAAQDARMEALEAECAAEKRLGDSHWRTVNDFKYQIGALVNMLGPNGRKVWEGWQTRGVLRVHYSWGPKAAKMTGEERAAEMLKLDDAIANGEAEEITGVDAHIAALGGEQHGG